MCVVRFISPFPLPYLLILLFFRFLRFLPRVDASFSFFFFTLPAHNPAIILLLFI